MSEMMLERAALINRQLAKYGVKFGIYKENIFHEQLFPYDVMPRIIPHEEFDVLEKGLIQRVTALNLFLKDIYGDKKILKDRIIPEEFVYSSKGYLKCCEGITPPGGVYSHISGIDLVQASDGTWYILEDNLRIPSGASYPLIARELTRRTSPQTFSENHVMDNRNYSKLLRTVMDDVSTGGINVILTPGRYNAAFFEHSYLAEKVGAILAFPQDLVVEEDVLYYKSFEGKKFRVGALYRRISDEYLDPLTFLPESLIGIPRLMEAYRAGNVAIINTPGNGVADDKGIYFFVPKMIEYYLKETPILKNAPTYLLYDKADREYVIENIDTLVIKDVSEAGGYGVVFGKDFSPTERQHWIELLCREPRRFIAQEVIDFIDLDVFENGQIIKRKADLRAFILTGKDVKVWPSGLTRFSRQPDSFIVNSSQGGGFKDTWVLSR